jgi:hypothetical protein
MTRALEALSGEIDALPDAIRHAAYPTAGVLSCRPVADTGRMSMHGYAAAIDLNVKISDYCLAASGKTRRGDSLPQPCRETSPGA